MATEVWFRNPADYIRELVEVGQCNVAWDRGYLVKKRLDPTKHASVYFGKAYPWRALVIGDQGTAELSDGYTMERPKAVYPTWSYGEDGALLEEIIERPVGEDEDLCNDMTVPPDERPVFGQDHRVVIIELPPSNSGPGRQMLRYLRELQEDNPQCKIHIHGLYTYRSAFGLGFASADMDARTVAQKGRVVLPSGREQRYEEVVKHPQWVTQLGFRPIDLATPRVRCMYNIKSAVWAGANYTDLFNFTSRASKKTVDTTTPTASVLPISTRSHIVGRAKPASGDMVACDTCSLKDKCRYFRDGAVCGVPSSDSSDLARYFKTRDSDVIIDGLGQLMQIGTERLRRGVEMEEALEELDPQVTKQLIALFDQGNKLAKLVNPALRGGTKVDVNVSSGSTTVQVGSPQQFIAGAVQSLVEKGIPRQNITPAMIEGVLTGMADPGRAERVLEGEVIRREDRAV